MVASWVPLKAGYPRPARQNEQNASWCPIARQIPCAFQNDRRISWVLSEAHGAIREGSCTSNGPTGPWWTSSVADGIQRWHLGSRNALKFHENFQTALRKHEIPSMKILTKKSLQIPNLCWASEFDSDTRLFPWPFYINILSVLTSGLFWWISSFEAWCWRLAIPTAAATWGHNRCLGIPDSVHSIFGLS